MIQPGMMFGGEGPVMQGTWYNPNTGDAFTVRDSFFEDNQYVVTTTDGRYLNYNQLQNYVQSDMKLEDLKKTKANTKSQAEVLPDEVSNLISGNDQGALIDELIIPEDMDILTKPQLGNIYTNTIKDPVTAATITPASMNTAIIAKALGNTAKPKITVDVDWVDYPAKQIEMLYDIMSIPDEEIVEWYLDNIQMTELVEAVKESIKNNIINKPENVTAVNFTDVEIKAKEENNKINGPKAKVNRVKKADKSSNK